MMTWTEISTRLLVIAMVGALVVVVGLTTAGAQETVEPTDAQKTLNDQNSDKETVASDQKAGTDHDARNDESIEQDHVSSPPAEESADIDALAVGVTVSGAALIGGAVGLQYVAESERSELTKTPGNVDSLTQVEARRIEKRANTIDSVAMAMGVGGAVVTGVGVYLFLNESEGDPEGVSVRVGAKDVGLVWMRRF